MSWVTPTGHNDPDDKWSFEEYAYDGETGPWYAVTTFTGYYLELTLTSAIDCDKTRIWVGAPSGDAYIDVDVYYDGAWNNIHSGAITESQWVELSIGATKSVNKARVKWNSGTVQIEVYEFAFGQVLEVSRERNILYDSVLKLSKTRNIVYDSVLELSKTRDILYDLVLELSKERNILYDSVLEVSKERNILYDLYSLAPSGYIPQVIVL